MGLILCRVRKPRRPPRVSGPLAARAPNGPIPRAARGRAAAAPTDFPSRLRDGCIPPRRHSCRVIAGHPAAGSVPRTKAALAAESERSPRGPRTKRPHRARRAAAPPPSPAGFPSRLRDGCIPPRLQFYLAFPGRNGPDSLPRTKAAPAAESERSPRGPQPNGDLRGSGYPTSPTLRHSPSRAQRAAAPPPPQRISHRACAMAASHRVCNSIWRSQVAMGLILCRVRKPRQPPKVSGPLAARNQTAIFEGAVTQPPQPSGTPHPARSARPRRRRPNGFPIALARWLHPTASAILSGVPRSQWA
jgi:hypothetical protein